MSAGIIHATEPGKLSMRQALNYSTVINEF